MPVQLKPPIGLPTLSTLAEEEAWSLLVASQLADVRKTAENWRNGLVALIGLVTTLSVIKGPEGISSLDHWAAYTVGLLLLLMLMSAVFGIWNSLVAAYGTASIITREAFHNLGGINGYRLESASKGVSKLRLAQAATFATMLLLVMAVGLTWYGPRTASMTLDVERKSLPNVCGTLVSSKDGYMDIKPSTSYTIRIYMSDIKSVSVKECP